MTEPILKEEELTQKHKKERKELQGIRIKSQISYQWIICSPIFFSFFSSKFV